MFQFTLPRGERLPIRVTTVGPQPVSIHAPAWGATPKHPAPRLGQRVSIHAPAWGATAQFGDEHGFSQFQFTLPRGERRRRRPRRAGVFGVSIHAPAWGATLEREVEGVEVRVSIHAPAWGATQQVRASGDLCHVSIHAPAWGATPKLLGQLPKPKFQFTLPRGERPTLLDGDIVTVRVSIHAPAWGATGAR